MGRRSSIGRLPAEIRDLIDNLLKRGRTLDEILAKLRELDVGVSRSALGRYKQDFDKVGERMRRVREIANTFVEKLGAVPEGKQGRLIVELMQTVIFEVLMAQTEGDDGAAEVKAQDVFFLAKGIRDLTQAEKMSAEREFAIRQETARGAAERAVAIAQKLATEKGVTLGRDALRRIREEVGILER